MDQYSQFHLGEGGMGEGRREERNDQFHPQQLSLPQRPCTSAISLYSFKIQLETFAKGNILGLHFYKDKIMR